MKHLYVFQFNKYKTETNITWYEYINMHIIHEHNINDYFIEMELQLNGGYCWIF